MTPDGRLRHLITLAGLPRRLLCDIFADADVCAADRSRRPLSGKLFINIFFESSTRTRTAFAAAAKQLGADVVNLDQTTMAGGDKSESLEDTVRTVAALGAAGYGFAAFSVGGGSAGGTGGRIRQHGGN